MAKAIMIQGTASNAGKSLITAGLCRILRQEGLKTAPFKAQNMALNSFVTEDGLEMGRAQAVQAQAAGIAPSVRMNPVLLKPTGEKTSRVIVNGKEYGIMTAAEYYARKKELIPLIREAYQSLAAEYDAVVLEGAGSPAEINLAEQDLANMFMARMAKAPVLLAGDIDRGGVFASLAGTMLLLSESDRRLVKGVLINKFRGDPAILEPGIEMLEQRIGCPVLGVIPWLEADIEEEDSLSGRLSEKGEKREDGDLDIAVIRLPRISNFTDFAPFERMEGVSVRYVSRNRELGRPDLILLPGTENPEEALLFLRETELDAGLIRAAGSGTALMGICGGCRILGTRLEMPREDGNTTALRGLGLLPLETVLSGERFQKRTAGTVTGPLEGPLAELEGFPFEGYESFAGRKKAGGEPEEGRPLLSRGNVYGTHIHGFFDRPETAEQAAALLRRQKGAAEPVPGKNRGISLETYRETQYNLLAEGIRKSVDIEAVLRILEQGAGE